MLPHSLSAGGVNRQVLLVRQVHEGPVTFLEAKSVFSAPSLSNVVLALFSALGDGVELAPRVPSPSCEKLEYADA